ncbi:aminopeptidase [Novimethylophilus kurashikiensis]|uniref:Aminopeptidase n=1 Tax=Novimethylophilus kurashikiensis TaxID=1825523 RepID=A0A2R5F9P1_9PROT|nr:aminopeptidase [Novimethylophilus kurashikiensis]
MRPPYGRLHLYPRIHYRNRFAVHAKSLHRRMWEPAPLVPGRIHYRISNPNRRLKTYSVGRFYLLSHWHKHRA